MNATRYTADHEWLRVVEDGNVIVGITDYAQEQLGDVVYVELPEAGKFVTAGEEAAVVESVKAASEIKMPLSGVVTQVNERLGSEPELVNQDPQGQGWFFRIKPDDPTSLENLMDEAAYQAFIRGL